ncbi:Deoxyribonuclease V [Bertholletia excelsa]
MAHQRTTMERDNMDGKEASLPATSCFPDIRNRWIETQETLKRRLITEDDFTWPLPPEGAATSKVEGRGEGVGVLKYVGGVDISFSKNDPFIACGALVVLDLYTLQVVYDDYSVVRLHTPYVPGFLAFREAPILLELLERMKNCAHPSYPQLLMVDGNGVLHPQGFGLACHLGVLANLPTIGIGKNLHHVDGLTQSRVRQLLEAKGSFDDDIITLTGDSGHIWGAAIQSTLGSVKPIFISVGHRVSLATAIKIVKMTCKYRVPEPIRQADIRSRDYLQKHQGVH